MSRTFRSGCFCFQVKGLENEETWGSSLPVDLESNSFDLHLNQTEKVPDLRGAPLASWLLARLARLTEGRLELASEEWNDGGGYAVEIVVVRVTDARPHQQPACTQRLLFDVGELYTPRESEQLVASLELQADMEGVEVIGERAPECPADEILEALATALLAEPRELLPCQIVVRDPEWEQDPSMYNPRPDEGSRNVYGWDGCEFLGKENTTAAR